MPFLLKIVAGSKGCVMNNRVRIRVRVRVRIRLAQNRVSWEWRQQQEPEKRVVRCFERKQNVIEPGGAGGAAAAAGAAEVFEKAG